MTTLERGNGAAKGAMASAWLVSIGFVALYGGVLTYDDMGMIVRTVLR